MGPRRKLPADSVGLAEVAALAGLDRSRISQLRAGMPAPDAESSTEARPRWQAPTVARWLAAEGRRLPPDTASWLLPGPDGPALRREGARILTVPRRPGATGPVTAFAPQPVHAHVATYSGGGHRLWLATPIGEATPLSFLSPPGTRPDASPLADLVAQLTEGEVPEAGGKGRLLGTLVLLTTAATHYDSPLRERETAVIDVFEGADARELDERLRRDRGDAALYADLARALGHRLPFWPIGCNTLDLVSAWSPELEEAVRCEIPPPAQAAWTFLQLCRASAARLAADEGSAPTGASLLALGRAFWHAKSRDFAEPHGSILIRMPQQFDPAVWASALRFDLPAEPAQGQVDFEGGLRWTQSSPDAPARLADLARDYFGDPDSAGVIMLDPAALPASVACVLGAPVTQRQHNSARQARAVLERMGAHPGVVLDTWPTPGRPRWRATAPGTPLVAVHVPTRMPSDCGEPLELVLTTAENDWDVGLVVTTTDAVLLLPASGGPQRLAAAIEHAIWHPGVPTPITGVGPALSRRLVEVIDSVLTAGTATIPWRRAAALVGPHPQRCVLSACAARADRAPGP